MPRDKGVPPESPQTPPPSSLLNESENSEWQVRVDPNKKNFADPIWRLANIYTIKTADGKVVHFDPSPEQRSIIWAIFVRGWQRIIIPKARQLGMSTLLALIALDGLVFRSGFAGALIDKTGADATKKMREKIRFGWERMPPAVRNCFDEVWNNDGELTLREKGGNGADSTIQGGINFRGGTVEFLWISEWGAIQNEDRARSREIKAGAMPAVEQAENGVCVIETTWKGGLDGELGAYVTEALSTPEKDLGPQSWRILFFPWWGCPRYSRSYGQIDATSLEYFKKIEQAGVVLTDAQKRWYAEKRRTATSDKTMMEEYPSLVHECWQNLPQGSIYGRWMGEALSEGRITPFLPDKRFPVHTYWDIGHPLNTVTWLMQVTPNEIRVLDILMEVDMTLEERAAHLRALGWDYGWHYLPWDADEKNTQSIKPIDEFRRVLGWNVMVVPKVMSVWDRINATRAVLPRCVFQSERCRVGIEHLNRYRAERESSTGISRDVPVHDRYSHAADAFGQMACAITAGLVENGSSVGGRVAAQGNKLMVKKAGVWR